MATPSFGQLADSPPLPPPAADAPFRIAVLGDFAGRRGTDPARRKPIPVDPDDLDVTLAATAPAVTLDELPGGQVELTFASFDDFHPDAVCRAADHFSDLSDTDERTEFMRAVLRHPRFRSAEAAWRGLDWLARRGRKGDRRVEIVLYDLTFDELAAGVNAADDLAETPIHKSLIGQAVHGPKGKPWGAVVGLYPFRVSADHAQVLGRLAKILADTAAPFLAGLDPADTDPAAKIAEDDQAAWDALRALPEAGLIGLAAPGFLLRLPFGERTRSIDSFEFEEFAGPDDRDAYLWGNPGLAAAAVVAQGFLKDGWAYTGAGALDLAGMPAHAYRDADDDEQLTVVERWLDRKAGERLTGLGVMSVFGVKGRDAAQLSRLHSLARPGGKGPPGDLFGRWGPGGAAPPPRSGVGLTVALGADAAPVAVATATVSAATRPGATAAPAPPRAAAAPPPAAADDVDPELAAMLADAAGESSSPPPPPADEMDPELAAMLAGLDAGTSPPPAEAPAAAAEEMDPELAAMLAALGGDSPPPPPPPAAPEPAADEMDPDLAAMLKELEGS